MVRNPKEATPLNPEILDIKTLSPQTKMRMILEIFDLGRGTEEERRMRRDNFMGLIGKYHEAIVKAKPESSISSITSSDVNKKKLHDQIMNVLQKMSLSLGIGENRRKLLGYLSSDRKEVERVIETYFLSYDPTAREEQSILKRALRGEGPFSSPPDKEND